ncbi:hypothetical protein ABFS83_11G116800 [Erythranthe nasuta]
MGSDRRVVETRLFEELVKSTDKQLSKYRIRAAEEFAEDYRDALDSVREEFAAYYNHHYSANTNHHHHHPPPPPPLPPPIASSVMLPPPIANDDDYDDEDIVNRRVEQLELYYKQRHAEVERIKDYRTRAMVTMPAWYTDEIHTTLCVFIYNIMCAIESFAEKLGDSSYFEQAPFQECMSILHRLRQNRHN